MKKRTFSRRHIRWVGAAMCLAVCIAAVSPRVQAQSNVVAESDTRLH